MRQFDVAGYYYSETVRRDRAAFTSEKKRNPSLLTVTANET